MRFISLTACICLLAFAGCSPVAKPENADTHYKLGISYLGSGDPTTAVRELRMAAEIDPENADIQAALGEAYFTKKVYFEAEKNFKSALQLDPGNPKYQNNLAALYVKMERYDEAIDYFQQAASNYMFPRPEMAWTGLGYAQYKKESYPEAIKAFDMAIASNWRFAAAYVGRGEVFHALGEYDKAILEFNQALDLSPASPTVHYNLALSYIKKRNKDLAISHFESVINLSPDSELSRQAKAFLSVLQ